MDNIITVKNLEKKYSNGFYALKNISFEIQKGSFFCLLGPNGAGKPTTMSILTTNLNKTKGKVEIAGFDLDKNEAQIRHKIGVIFQKPSLDDSLTAEENIRLHATIYGLYRFAPTYSFMSKDYKKRLHELSEVLGMQKAIFRKIEELSGGMKRRFEIIRGLMHHPEILFLDEPSTGIDPESRRDLWDYLRTVRDKEGLTIVFSTHYLDEAENADTVCIINKGEIIENGTPNSLRQKLVRDFIVFRVNENLSKELLDETNSQQIEYVQISSTVFHISLRENNPQKIISTIKTPLELIDIERPSLEDAYLDIISQTNTTKDE